MTTADFKDMDSEDLKAFIETSDESTYTIIDVRQPEEYNDSHIPGTKHIPLSDIVSGNAPLPGTETVVFTCRSGARSRAAAVYAESVLDKNQTIINHNGGIIGWYGQTLPGTPGVQLLGDLTDFDEILLAAMDLEKGAWNYYKTILETFSDEPFRDAMEYLSLAEADHAEALYRIMEKRKLDNDDERPLPGFDDLFYGMKGDILEGGMPLAEAVDALKAITEDRSVQILELSLSIEYSAFDLYKNAALLVEDPEIKKILNGIANGEKNHMKKLAEAFKLI